MFQSKAFQQWLASRTPEELEAIRVAEKPKTYAELKWTVDDVMTVVQTADLDMTYKEAEQFLEDNAKHLQSRLCELGHQVIEDLLREARSETSTPSG